MTLSNIIARLSRTLLAEAINTVQLLSAVIDHERHRSVCMCSQFKRCGMVGADKDFYILVLEFVKQLAEYLSSIRLIAFTLLSTSLR